MDIVVWTGSEVLAVGRDVRGATYGVGGSALDPRTSTWRVLPFMREPEVTDSSVVEGLWTGTELVVVVTGRRSGPASGPDVALVYRPGSNSWQQLPTPPSSPAQPTMLWTGRALVLVGDLYTAVLQLAPRSGTWGMLRVPAGIPSETYPAGHDLLAMNLTQPGLAGLPAWQFTGSDFRWRRIPSPPPVSVNPGAAIWTGDRFDLVQRACGNPAELAQYDPSSHRWTQRTIDPSPLSCASGAVTLWDGTEIIISGTPTYEQALPPGLPGAALNPATGHWRQLPLGPDLGPADVNVVWDGTEMLVIGGHDVYTNKFVPGAAYRPPSPLPPYKIPPATIPVGKLPTCSAAELRAVSLGISPVSNETVSDTITLTNNGTGPCQLQGAPGIEPLDGNHQPIPITIQRGDGVDALPGSYVGPVALQPGSQADAVVVIQYEHEYGLRQPCPKSVPSVGGLVLTLPGQAPSVPVTDANTPSYHGLSTHQIEACGSSITLSGFATPATNG